MGTLHNVIAWPLIGVTGLIGVWALAAHWVMALRVKALWSVTAVGHALIFAHAMLGGLAVATDDREVGAGHMFYGFLTLTAIAILYGYRRQLAEHLYLLYGLGGLFVMGLAIRAALLPAWA